MKKAFLLIVACTFAFVSAHAQDSDVERVNQLTKPEVFKAQNSFIKEAEIYECSIPGAIKAYAKLFTNLNTGEQIAALEFQPTILNKMLGGGLAQPLGYLDMDHIDDLILALERMLDEHNKADKKDKYTITYTAPGGIDAFYVTNLPGQSAPIVMFRKKWYKIDDYGVKTSNYSEGYSALPIKVLPNFISMLKEAQAIAKQSLVK